ncbi:hypothetical protein GCM10009557_04940 [Virgisporangium ochraceum]|uniref:Uncharacterized protein n=1 Tax=Virgisporangium ochraceum TaxID=65505 RepID=A0A8J4EC76_9ACTN|nr:hypothetical protein [Virgisporangium ochraceum]GIJ70195.1 hypothetical protein Voc01_051120 [Virgisporangium ochraceum]
MTTELPTRPDLTQLRGQAKDLRRAVVGGNPAALKRAEALKKRPDEFTLRDAQLVVAREYGFAGWHDLMTEVGRKQVAERDLHRWFGVQLNNETWDLLEQIGPHSPLADRERLLYAAYASTYHWLEAGNTANHARGEHLIASVAVRIGEPDLALRHARRCAQLVEEHPEAMEDWDRPLAAEVLARSLAATGDGPGARAAWERAKQLVEVVAEDGERRAVEDLMKTEPAWP